MLRIYKEKRKKMAYDIFIINDVNGCMQFLEKQVPFTLS
jgi:hypothetical protein